MTLYLETSTGFKEWHGEPIDGRRHPRNIEMVWSPDELAAIGLYAPVDPGVPAGKVVVGERVTRENGVVMKVYQFEDAPPPPPPPKEVADRLQDIEARLAALEALAAVART